MQVDYVPPLASWDFHIRFFPALLIGRFRKESPPLSLNGVKGFALSYDRFLFGLFFFSLLLGADIGLVAAVYHPWWIKVLLGTTGAVAGYWAGLLVGIHAQRLGFVADILNQLSVPGAIGLSIPAILLLLPQ